MIKAGSDLNRGNPHGDTPLMIASWKGHAECVNLLLMAGADVNKVHPKGYTALTAPSGGHYECIERLMKAGTRGNIEYPYRYSTLMKASGCAHRKCVDLLLKSGVNVSTEKEQHFLGDALVDASSHGNLSLMKLLVKSGASVNAFDWTRGCSAVAAAAEAGYYNCVKFLIEAGADVNRYEDGLGRVALSMTYSLEILDLLIEAGACVNHDDEFGNTALSLAVERGSVEFADRLIKAGADVNWCPVYSAKTPLTKAVQRGQYKCVDFLIKAGADVNTANRERNKTILQAVFDDPDQFFNLHIKTCCTGIVRCIKIILRAGTKLNKGPV